MPLDTCAASYFRPSSKPQAARLCALNAAGSCASGGLHDCPVDPATVSPPSPPSPPPPVTAIPAEGVKVLSGGNAEATLVKCMWPGDEQVTTADHGRNTIAAQCCEMDGTCRREVDGTCVAGKSSRGAAGGGIEPMTYGEAVAKCAQLSLELCGQSCAGSGCSYNSHPVWSRLPCDSLPAPPPPPPSPPPPPPGIPAEGVQVLQGSRTGAQLVTCVRPGDEQVETAPWKLETIAAQCCETDGTCRRQDVDGTCVAGVSDKTINPGGGIEPMTYGEAVVKCAQLGLELCDKSCAGKGCGYNRHPVWSRLPCEA